MGCRSSNLAVVTAKAGETSPNPAIAAAQFIMVNPGDMEKDLNFLKTNGYQKSDGTNKNNGNANGNGNGNGTDGDNNNIHLTTEKDNPFKTFGKSPEPNNNNNNNNDDDSQNKNLIVVNDNNNSDNGNDNSRLQSPPSLTFLRVKNGIVTSPFAQYRKPIPNFHIWKYLMTYIERYVEKNGTDCEWLREATSEGVIKYSDLEPQTRKLASAFTRQGLKAHDVVIFMTTNTLHIYLVLLSLWRLNATVKILCPDDTNTDTLTKRITESNVKFLVCDKNTSKTTHEARKKCVTPLTVFSMGKLDLFEAADIMDMLKDDDGSEFPGDLQDFNSDVNNDVIYIPSTSGSTSGSSNNVLHTHKTMVAALMNCQLFRSSIASTYTMMPMRTYHLSGILWPFAILLRGKAALLIETISTQVIFEAIQKYETTILCGFPSFVITLSLKLDECGLVCPCIRSICTSGETISQSGVDKLKLGFPGLKSVDVSYMMAEMLCVTSTIPCVDVEAGSDNATKDSLDNKIGYLNCYSSAKIINPDSGEVLNVNQSGELCLRAPSIMKGYENSTERSNLNAGWLHTGDCGFYDENGMFHVVGRLSEIFKSNGEYVNPSKLEQLLMNNPDVSACAVLGIPDEDFGTITCAVVSRKFGSAVTAADLKSYVESQVEESQRLRGDVIFIDELPKTKAGKVNKQEVLRMVVNLNKMKSLRQR